MTAKKNITATEKEFDILLGARIKERRVFLGLARAKLAPMIGVTHQQLMKYEIGDNRVTVARLVRICRILKWPMAEAMRGLPGVLVSATAADLSPAEEAQPTETLGLIAARNFAKVKSRSHRQALSVLIRALAEDNQ